MPLAEALEVVRKLDMEQSPAVPAANGEHASSWSIWAWEADIGYDGQFWAGTFEGVVAGPQERCIEVWLACWSV